MSSIVDKFKIWVEHVIERRLLAVKGVIYFYDTPDYAHPQQLQFVFSNTITALTLKCDGDGSSLGIVDSPLQNTDLGDYGKEVVMDLSLTHPFINLIDKELLRTSLIYSTLEDSYIGIKFMFNEEQDLFILNLGDELNVLDSLPESFLEDEGIKCFNFSR